MIYIKNDIQVKGTILFLFVLDQQIWIHNYIKQEHKFPFFSRSNSMHLEDANLVVSWHTPSGQIWLIRLSHWYCPFQSARIRKPHYQLQYLFSAAPSLIRIWAKAKKKIYKMQKDVKNKKYIITLLQEFENYVKFDCIGTIIANFFRNNPWSIFTP